MTYSYTNDPSASDVAAVRFEIQDTNSTAPLLADEEIAWAILNETGQTANPDTVAVSAYQLYCAAARCCEVLVVNFTRQADTEIGQMKVTYSTQAQNFDAQAKRLRAKASGMNAPYAGGQSISDKISVERDTDAEHPMFSRREFDNRWGGRAGWDAGLPPSS